MCRVRGWERARRCGYLTRPISESARVVWSRNGAESEECPVSSISGKSVALLEEFELWKAVGRPISHELELTKVEAFTLLDKEERRIRDGGI